MNISIPSQLGETNTAWIYRQLLECGRVFKEPRLTISRLCELVYLMSRVRMACDHDPDRVNVDTSATLTKILSNAMLGYYKDHYGNVIESLKPLENVILDYDLGLMLPGNVGRLIVNQKPRLLDPSDNQMWFICRQDLLLSGATKEVNVSSPECHMILDPVHDIVNA